MPGEPGPTVQMAHFRDSFSLAGFMSVSGCACGRLKHSAIRRLDLRMDR